MTIVFFGSSEFSIPVLSALMEKQSVRLVVTTPEKKKGRGQKVSGTVVKDFALKHGLSCLEPEKLSDPQFVGQIETLSPDFIVVASYGKLIPSSVFSKSKIAPLNVHPSLLPKHRGASPIQRSILEGNQKTGVSIAEVTKDLDAGDLFAQIETNLDVNENANQLSHRLSEMAAKLVLEVIDRAKNGNLKKTPQSSASQETYAKKMTKEEGQINWNQPNIVIHNQARAYNPWPGAFTFVNDKRLKILQTALITNSNSQAQPGEIIMIDHNGIVVQTQMNQICLEKVQLEGRNEIGAYEFALGQRLKSKDRFSSQ